ncbi:hypothetical protein [Roseateles saccharophilus]|uniref:L,D-transpeptidase-like protein n=1 Tax=Roseateles saccharophilus TaxID=304 RepID=A0A4R3UKC8_ROSSA|nr:hypothetical protein [Roseateles saccharophilus]MDG0834023.1 hypothetical protein [Roseateles saccharophilus]TCU90961.1 hypothetical protein EV671_102839 [Roseateles saccharophilus]
MGPGARPADAAAAARQRRDILAGLRQGGLIAALVLAALFPFLGGALWRHPAPAAAQRVAAAPAASPLVRRLDFGDVRAPRDVTQVAAWAVREADNGDRAFAIVDKRRARVYVFAAGGRLLGTSPVLLGYAVGDFSVTGIGHKAIDDIRPQERTTPAGRFESTPGRNSLGHEVVWVDYEAAVSMHRVRVTDPRERRLERLATPSAADKRISWGCINVPVAFFDQIVWPQLGHGRGVVYVLPETRALTAFFPAAAPAVLAQAIPRRGNSAKP